MTTDEIGERVDCLDAAISEAGKLALGYFRNLGSLTVETKANAQDIVSRADRDVEDKLRARIADRFPQDGFIGEERGVTQGTSGYVWVIDPIDGTSAFLSGLDHWCISVALCKDDQTVAGAILDPNKDEVIAAVLGGGATLNGKSLRLDRPLTLADGLCGVGASHRIPPAVVSCFIHLLLEEGGMYFRNGSGALMLAQVAAGRLAAYYEPHMNAWDCLAGLLIVREAGGWAQEYPGDRTLIAGAPVAASNPAAAAQLQSLIARANAAAAG